MRLRPRLSVLTLLLLPAMFAAGWWTRGLNYNRDVYIAAEQIALETGGVFIPEIGLFHGDKQLAKKLSRMPPEMEAELQRRIEFIEETHTYYNDSMIPEQPGLFSSALFAKPDDAANVKKDNVILDDGTDVGSLESLGDDKLLSIP